ncbi:MAG: polysaccharide deacetylase family protein [Pseudohongiellaceae bacterium]
MVKTGLATGMHYTGMDRLIGTVRGETHQPLVVTYHRVVENFEASAASSIEPMLISAATLQAHLEWLGQYYRFVSLDELADYIDDTPLGGKPVASITFDDGYADVFRNAYPVLKRMGIPFAVFVVSDFVGTNRMHIHDELFLLLSEAVEQWRAPRTRLSALVKEIKQGSPDPAMTLRLGKAQSDPFNLTRVCFEMLSQVENERLIERLRQSIGHAEKYLEEFSPLDWDMLKEMANNGVTIGSHTRTHSLLSCQLSNRVQEEITGSKSVLEERLGIKITHFAYPDGRFNADTVRSVAAAGYRCAYTICRHQDSQYPWLTIPRKVLWENSCLGSFGKFSPSIMSCQVNGIFDPSRNCHQKHEGSAPIGNKIDLQLN